MALPIAAAAASTFVRTVASGAGTMLARGGGAAIKALQHTGGGELAKTALTAAGKGMARSFHQLPAATQTALRQTALVAAGATVGHAIADRRG
jgi:hypothetical protein